MDLLFSKIIATEPKLICFEPPLTQVIFYSYDSLLTSPPLKAKKETGNNVQNFIKHTQI